MKRDRAINLLRDPSLALSIQVLQEFYVQATRASRADGLSHSLAVLLIEKWSRFRIQEMTLAVLKEALRIRDTHVLSFWDSTIISAALAQGCDTLYTEDLNHGQVVESLRIINPFRVG